MSKVEKTATEPTVSLQKNTEPSNNDTLSSLITEGNNLLLELRIAI